MVKKEVVFMIAYVIGAVIVGYTGYLIYRQVKNVKEKNYCGHCAGCPSAKACSSMKKEMK